MREIGTGRGGEGGGGERDAPSDLEDCALDVPGLARCGVCVRQRERQREKERERVLGY